MWIWPLTVRGTGALVLAIACFVVAAEFGVGGLVYFGVLLLAVVASSVATLYFVRRTETVSRSFDPDVASVGQETTVQVRVGVRTALPSAQGGWREELSTGLSGEARGVFPAVSSGFGAGGRAITFDYRIRADRRGVRGVGPLLITATDPFGFARRRHVLGSRTPLTVTPTIVDLAAPADLPGDPGGSLHASTNQIGEGTDNLIPRSYVPGDSMRRIHWRSSAHHDALMVRQEEQESTPEATIVFDRGAQRWSADAFRTPGADPRFESGVTACVSAAARLVREGFTVTIIDSDGTPLAEQIEAGDGAGIESLALDFATVTARRDDHLAALPALFTGIMAGPVIVIVGSFDEKDADVLAPLAHHSALPILMAVTPLGDALAHAAQTGWRTAAISPDDDLARAWASATDRGVSHVNA